MRQAIKAPLVIPVLGLLVASAMAASPAAAADPDTCDPDSFESENSCAKAPADLAAGAGQLHQPRRPWLDLLQTLLRPGRLHRAQGRRHASGAVRVRDRTRRDRRLRPRADGSPGRDPGPAVATSAARLRLRERTRPWRDLNGPRSTSSPAWRRSLRDGVGELPEGHRLANGDAWCAVGYQGSVSCVSGDNGFVLAWWGGLLEKPT